MPNPRPGAGARQGRPAEALGLSPTWNRRPGEECLVVLQDPQSGARILSTMRWGLPVVSSPAAKPVLYLRAETVGHSPTLRQALRRRRCIVPMDGYVQRASDPRAPARAAAVALADGAPMAVAAVWQDTEDGPRFALLTCEASEAIRPVHDRMPAILPASFWPHWLGTDALSPPDALRLIRPCQSDLLRVNPIDSSAKRRRSRRRPTSGLGEQLDLLAPGAPVLRPGRPKRRASARRARAEARSKAATDALG